MTTANARTIFVVEDDTKIRAILVDYLTHFGYAPVAFADGRGVVEAARRTAPAAILLDLMLPGVDGIALCKALRSFCAAPILMITARVDEIDRLQGLDIGADDYICKPFSAREVMARLAAIIRRSEGRVTSDIAADRLYTIDDPGQRIAWRGQWLDLSPSEFRILAALMRQPGWIFTRDQLLDVLGDRSLDSSDRAIDSHIKNIRRKLSALDATTQPLSSVYGAGYRFDLPKR